MGNRQLYGTLRIPELEGRGTVHGLRQHVQIKRHEEKKTRHMPALQEEARDLHDEKKEYQAKKLFQHHYDPQEQTTATHVRDKKPDAQKKRGPIRDTGNRAVLVERKRQARHHRKAETTRNICRHIQLVLQNVDTKKQRRTAARSNFSGISGNTSNPAA